MATHLNGYSKRALGPGFMSRLAAVVLIINAVCHAITVPVVDGMSVVWSDDFNGDADECVDRKSWDIAGSALKVNSEEQVYTDSSDNLRLSGSQTAQFIPIQDADGNWTSSRIESKGSWMAESGSKLRIQASLRVGSCLSHSKKGIWPAFWTLGDAVRHGTQWPLCGELDVMERVNGALTAFATAHCQQDERGICDEPSGKQQAVSIPDDDGFHTWSIEWDRTSKEWLTESITWRLDNVPFYTLTGADINDEHVWATLDHSPYYMILNVAVGGTWPGSSDPSTESGEGNMLEAEYVAVYEPKWLADRKSASSASVEYAKTHTIAKSTTTTTAVKTTHYKTVSTTTTIASTTTAKPTRTWTESATETSTETQPEHSSAKVGKATETAEPSGISFVSLPTLLPTAILEPTSKHHGNIALEQSTRATFITSAAAAPTTPPSASFQEDSSSDLAKSNAKPVTNLSMIILGASSLAVILSLSLF